MWKFITLLSLIPTLVYGADHTYTKTLRLTRTRTRTVTVTKSCASERQHKKTTTRYQTKTVCIKPTSTHTITPTHTQNNDDNNDGVPASQRECLKYFNDFRKSIGVPTLKPAPESYIDCANRAAINDAARGYHNSFYSRMCTYARAQCECMKGVHGGGLKNCIDAYISEGPPGTIGQYPQENHGHYKIISSPDFTHVACGTDNDGFFTHNFY